MSNFLATSHNDSSSENIKYILDNLTQPKEKPFLVTE